MRRVAAVLVLAGAVLPVGASASCARAAAAGMHRAAVVIEYPDASVSSLCVAFAEPSITGLELLQRSGVRLAYQSYGGDQITVCSINGKGCPFPQRPCFCQCADTSRCTFWGYYTVNAGTWSFSTLGAAQRVVHDGDVDGWRWGKQTTTGGNPPATSATKAICAAAAIASPTPAPGATPSKRKNPAAYAILGLVLAGLALGAIYRARRRMGPFE